jgi:hypothetical protein
MRRRHLRIRGRSITFAQIWWLAAMLGMFVLAQTATGAAASGIHVYGTALQNGPGAHRRSEL